MAACCSKSGRLLVRTRFALKSLPELASLYVYFVIEPDYAVQYVLPVLFRLAWPWPCARHKPMVYAKLNRVPKGENWWFFEVDAS